jgi:hypothetical protein
MGLHELRIGRVIFQVQYSDQGIHGMEFLFLVEQHTAIANKNYGFGGPAGKRPDFDVGPLPGLSEF